MFLILCIFSSRYHIWIFVRKAIVIFHFVFCYIWFISPELPFLAYWKIFSLLILWYLLCENCIKQLNSSRGTCFQTNNVQPESANFYSRGSQMGRLQVILGTSKKSCMQSEVKQNQTLLSHFQSTICVLILWLEFSFIIVSCFNSILRKITEF